MQSGFTSLDRTAPWFRPNLIRSGAVLPDGRQETLIERRTRRLFVQGNGKPITRRKTPNPSSAKAFRAAYPPPASGGGPKLMRPAMSSGRL